MIRQHGDDALNPEDKKGNSKESQVLFEVGSYIKKTTIEYFRTFTDLVTRLPQVRDEALLQLEAGMVTPEVDAHDCA